MQSTRYSLAFLQFRTATPQEVAQLPRIVDPQLLEGATVNFSRSMIRLASLLQHVETLLPMAGEIQAELNYHITSMRSGRRQPQGSKCCGQATMSPPT